jgi:hypothetical protein
VPYCSPALDAVCPPLRIAAANQLQIWGGRRSEALREKYRAHFRIEEIPHGDTLHAAFPYLKVEEVQEVIWRMMEKLMKFEELKKWRLFGACTLIAVDGTGVLSYRQMRQATWH